jgi:predicted branched-subunit amino acid permease
MTAADLTAIAAQTAARPSAVRQAVSDTAPFAIALIPFGLAAGGAAATSGLSAAEAMFGAIVMLAGAAQLAAIDAIGANAGPAAVIMVVALVNLRFVLYGAGVASWFADASRRRRLVLAYPVVDQTFLLCQQRFDDRTELAWRQRYYIAVTSVLGGTFVGAQLVSFQLGASLPDGVGLHLAAPLAFTGLLARSITDRRTLMAAIVAAAAFVVAAGIAGPLVLPIAVTVGVSAALLIGAER